MSNKADVFLYSSKVSSWDRFRSTCALPIGSKLGRGNGLCPWPFQISYPCVSTSPKAAHRPGNYRFPSCLASSCLTNGMHQGVWGWGEREVVSVGCVPLTKSTAPIKQSSPTAALQGLLPLSPGVSEPPSGASPGKRLHPVQVSCNRAHTFAKVSFLETPLPYNMCFLFPVSTISSAGGNRNIVISTKVRPNSC